MIGVKKPPQWAVKYEEKNMKQIMLIPEIIEDIELWGQSPHNGVWFPIRIWPISALIDDATAARWFQLSLKVRYQGQMSQLNCEEPSECLISTPQDATLLHDIGTLMGGKPDLMNEIEDVVTTDRPAIGQSNEVSEVGTRNS